MKLPQRQFTPDTPFESSIGVSSAEVGAETVVCDALRDHCYRLNRSAAQIWRLVAGGTRFKDVAQELVREYALEEEPAFEEAEAFLASLIDLGLAATSSTVGTKAQEGGASKK